MRMAKHLICRLFGHRMDISVIESIEGHLHYTSDRCSRCGHYEPNPYLTLSRLDTSNG